MDGVTGQILWDPVTHKKMGHHQVTNGQYQYHIKTDRLQQMQSKKAPGCVHWNIWYQTPKIINPVIVYWDHQKAYLVMHGFIHTIINVSGKWIKYNSAYLRFCKKSQNWYKSMRLKHHIKSASFLDKRLWEIIHVDGKSTKIHMYYGGAHANPTIKGCKHAAPSIWTKSIIHCFISAVVQVDEFHTSQVCFDCDKQTHSVRKKGGKMIWTLLYCGSDECKSCRYKDRDENGTKNIFKVGNDTAPDISSRKVSWKNSKCDVRYPNTPGTGTGSDDHPVLTSSKFQIRQEKRESKAKESKEKLENEVESCIILVFYLSDQQQRLRPTRSQRRKHLSHIHFCVSHQSCFINVILQCIANSPSLMNAMCKADMRCNPLLFNDIVLWS